MHINLRGLLTSTLFTLVFASSLFGQVMPQNFVSVTPCRIADTRTSGSGGTDNSIPAGTYRNFPVVGAAGADGGPACNIPSNASAFSLNVTAVPPSGSSLLFLSVLPGTSSPPSGAPSSSTLNDPTGTIVANAAIVPSGSNGSVEVYVSGTSDVILDIDGYFVDQTVYSTQNTSLGTGAGGSTGTYNTAIGADAIPSGSGSENVAVGAGALENNTTGGDNTTVGSFALLNDTTGSYNSGLGYEALRNNTTGYLNSAFGYEALVENTSGLFNSAFGPYALAGNTSGHDNTGVGYFSLYTNTTGAGNVSLGNQASYYSIGNDNTAVGFQAFYYGTSGSGNIALGYFAGEDVTTGSDNIEIGNEGFSSDNLVIRIGTPGVQMTTYIAGIYNATAASGSTVLVNSNGQLGTINSSIRFKEDVHEMGDSTDALMQLRPVEFRYKQPAEDGTKPFQFGLVAEEVAKVYPELVVRGTDGQIDSVKYHELPAMLLNEIQKQHRIIADQEQRLNSLQAQIESLRALVAQK